MEKEFIICAAIYYDDKQKHEAQPINIETGFVIAGRRHHNCYSTLKAINTINGNNTLKDLIMNQSKEEHRKHQGFITSLDRYVDRREGFNIAYEANQIIGTMRNRLPGPDVILVSEDLY